MGALRKVLAQFPARLRDVTTSQKVALLLGGALVAVSLVWLVQWAARPELVPLLDQDLQPEELALVRAGLEALGEAGEVRGSRMYVRAGANRQALLAQLQLREQLPGNTSVGFAALVRESDPWISQAENERRWTYALQKELEQVLSQFQGVRDARVFLNIQTQRSLTQKAPPRSASVTLVMKHGDSVPRSLAVAAARLVAGAVAGMRVHDVQVVDASGSPAVDWASEQDATNVLSRHLVKEEQRYTEKIRLQVPDPKALISVQVELDTTTRSAQTEEPLRGQPLSEETTRESTTRVRAGEVPGVQPNTGLALGGGGADEAHEQETSKTELRPGVAIKTEATPPGEVKQVTAAISLSYSYLEGVYRHANPGAAAPTEAQIEEVFERERARLVQQVAKLVRPQTADNVAIARYYDTAVQPAEAGPGAALDGALELARQYGPQSGLALLALVALGMMLRLARKTDTGESFGLELGLPPEAIEAAKLAAEDVATVPVAPVRAGRRARGARGGPPAEEGGDLDLAAPVPQAAVTEGMLVAQEVDAATVQTRKMLDQVAEMVSSDPETVATLVEQWIQRSDQYREGG